MQVFICVVRKPTMKDAMYPAFSMCVLRVFCGCIYPYVCACVEVCVLVSQMGVIARCTGQYVQCEIET